MPEILLMEEILHQLIGSQFHYLQVFFTSQVVSWISEPSTVPSLFKEGRHMFFFFTWRFQKRRCGQSLETCAMEVREMLIKKIEKGCQASIVGFAGQGGGVVRAKGGGDGKNGCCFVSVSCFFFQVWVWWFVIFSVFEGATGEYGRFGRELRMVWKYVSWCYVSVPSNIITLWTIAALLLSSSIMMG